MNRRKWLTVVLMALPALLAAQGCTSPEREAQRNLEATVPVQEIESFLDENEDLVVRLGDARALLGYAIAHAFGEGAEADTMTLGEIVDWVNEADAREAQREAERDRIAREEREQRDAFRQEMEDLLEVVLLDKGFMPSNPSARRYEDYITFVLVYENRGEVDIRGFRGTMRFMDLFGETIMELRLTVDDPLPAGERRVDGEKILEYNRFRDPHRRLRSTEFENIRARWVPETILLTDGQELSIDG